LGGIRAGGAAICVLGDAHLDVIVCPCGPLAEETDTPARTAAGAGGQAANVAAWVAALGGRARLIAARGTDPASRLVTDELAARGVAITGPVIDGRTGVVVSLADGTSRSMLTDRGVGPLLDPSHIKSEWFGDCAWLHLPAYSLVSMPIGGAALAAAALVRNVSVDLSSTAALRAHGVSAFRRLLAQLKPGIVFGTEAEAELVGELPGTEVVVKLGARGVRVGGAVHAAPAARAVDSTGAGDAFAAGYLLGGVGLGLRAASRAVAKMGAMP
jgi:ribokinase